MTSNEETFRSQSLPAKFYYFLYNVFDKPITWFRESIVEPNRQVYYWYHERIRRVPTIDQCLTYDSVCQYEADEQFKRDRMVDGNIIFILRRRFDHCLSENKNNHDECNSLGLNWAKATTNFFIKYGDLGFAQKSLACYMKQKHRMAWERRHGPVGTGNKNIYQPPTEEEEED